MADDVFESLDGFEIQMDTYALYLYYRVQHSLYEILKDQMPELTWQDAIYIFRSVKEILDSSRYVLIMTIADFCQKGSYDFYGDEAEMVIDDIEIDENDEKIHAADLSNKKNFGRRVIGYFIGNAMAALCKEMSEKTGIQITTATQLAGLPGISEYDAMSMLMRGFRRALTQLDFESMWKSIGLDYLEKALEKSRKDGE